MTGLDALFPDPDSLTAAENALTESLVAAREAAASGRAVALDPSPVWIDRLRNMRFDQPLELAELAEWVIEGLVRSTMQTTHPGYLGLFNPAPTFAAECGDRIAAALNPQICVHSHAPAAVEIELHVIREVARRAGLPDGSGGHFTSCGSEANSTALLCALQARCPDYGNQGLTAFAGQPSVYVSRESHMAWVKMAHAAGIGRQAVRLIATDGRGRLMPDALEDAVSSDIRAGHVPVLVAATAGTTNAGMIDPLIPCHQVARRHGMWFHVDAAWGGALIASDAHRRVLDGMELADSITIDGHKWFAATMGTGMFLTSRPEVPSQVFHVATDYMPEGEVGKDFYLNSNLWSRRFVGLRLFLALGAAGWRGFARHITNSIRLTDHLAEGLQRHGWSLANASPMAVACLVPPEGHDAVPHYVRAVLEDGRFWVSETAFEGQSVLRACVTNGRTTQQDMDALVDLLASVSR